MPWTFEPSVICEIKSSAEFTPPPAGLGHALVIPGRLMLEHAVGARGEVVELVLALHIGRGRGDDVARIVEQVNLHAGQRNIGWPEYAIALRIGPHAPRDTGRQFFAKIVIHAVHIGAERDL